MTSFVDETGDVTFLPHFHSFPLIVQYYLRSAVVTSFNCQTFEPRALKSFATSSLGRSLACYRALWNSFTFYCAKNWDGTVAERWHRKMPSIDERVAEISSETKYRLSASRKTTASAESDLFAINKQLSLAPPRSVCLPADQSVWIYELPDRHNLKKMQTFVGKMSWTIYSYDKNLNINWSIFTKW